MNRRQARATTKCFALNRERFAQATRKDFGDLNGADATCEGDFAVALSHRFHDALEAGAISGPPGIEVIVYALEDSVIVAVREEALPRNLSLPTRQLATYSFETKHVLDPRDGSFGELCAALESLLERANALLPSFEALRVGEEALSRGGRLWRLAVALAK